MKIWLNTDRTRFFLIPDDRQLPSGNFTVQRGINHQIEVDPAAIQAFEITREQAKTWLDSQWDEVCDRAKRSTVELFDRWSTPATETPISFDPETREKLANGIEELAKVLAQRLRNPDRDPI